MERELVVVLMRLLKAYQAQAEEQALAAVKWQSQLAAIEGELLKLVQADVTATLKPQADDDDW